MSISRRATGSRSSRRCSRSAKASPAGCDRPAFDVRTVAVKIRDTDFVTITRQRTLADPTDSTDTIWRTAVALTRREVRGMSVRLLGVAASGLTEQQQLTLFEAGDQRRQRATEATDEVRKKFRVTRHSPRAVARRRSAPALRARPAPTAPRGSRTTVRGVTR